MQRVLRASVVVDGQTVGEAERGLLVYLGAADGDTESDVEYMAKKVAGLRIFRDDEGKMSRSVADVNGDVLVISQFTLFGDVRKGKRPSFTAAAPPALAEQLYNSVVDRLRDGGLQVATGQFRALMTVHSEVDGPVTIQIDSKKHY